MRIDVKFYIDLRPKERINIKIKREKTNYKALFCFALALALLINLPMLYAYEAHIINVTATICHKSEARTMGYWKNHLEVAEPYFPIWLGDLEVLNSNQATVVFANANSKDMAVMLRAQLLAMKLNIKHFGIGDYWVESYGMNLYGLTALADDLLTEPYGSRQEMEDVKDALVGISEMELLRVCLDKGLLPQVRVLEPNGGEEWEIGSQQIIRWTAINPGGLDSDLIIDIWYCNDSGNNCYYPIEQDTDNDGEYLWDIPNNMGFETNSFNSKIKIIAIDSVNILRMGYDMSDENFSFKPEPEPELEPGLLESVLGTETESNNEAFTEPELPVEIITEITTESSEETFNIVP